MRRWICLLVCALAISACGGSYDYQQRRDYVDKCIVETGPQTEHNNVTDYCEAKWRLSQREK